MTDILLTVEGNTIVVDNTTIVSVVNEDATVALTQDSEIAVTFTPSVTEVIVLPNPIVTTLEVPGTQGIQGIRGFGIQNVYIQETSPVDPVTPALWVETDALGNLVDFWTVT